MEFKLTKNETESLRKRIKKIRKKYRKCGHITYSFTPTGLGNVVKIHFEVNNKTYDISDKDCW